MLGALPDDVADAAAEEDARAQTDGPEIRVVQQRAQLAGCGVVGIAEVGLEGAHVGVFELARAVDCTVVVLVAVAGVEQDGVAQLGQGDLLFDGLARVAVRAVGLGLEVHALALDQVLDDVAAAVLELSGVDLVQRVLFGGLGDADVAVHRGQTGVAGHAVEPDLGGLDGRGLLADVEQKARRAHGGEGAGSDDIDLAGGLDLAFLAN